MRWDSLPVVCYWKSLIARSAYVLSVKSRVRRRFAAAGKTREE